ncbi:tetratricopeptide repeat protein 34 [Trichomycterus rosablanca]|uniref:tetratricopeptide repeat protein 34 n=1 Tax=Trichomycterus rosablanca TaxID=2290929 RepID=UPI002F3549EE
MAHMHSLDRICLEQVILALESWLDSHGVTQKSMDGLNKGLAAVFLSTLCPNNVSASVFKMESVLLGAGYGSEEIFARCSALLKEKATPCPKGLTRLILELTSALACLLSDMYNPKCAKLYLQAFLGNRSETVRLVKGRHAEHLPRIVKAFFEQMAPKFPMVYTECKLDNIDNFSASDSVEFLLAISPDNTLVRELQAGVLFSQGKFDESAEALTLALQLSDTQTDAKTNFDLMVQGTPPERRASLLVARAAALFSAGGRVSEACQDLAEGFAVYPATARHQFQRLFSKNGTGALVRIELRQQAEKGLSSFRETVLLRSDLRSTAGMELLDPVIAQLRALCHLEPGGGGRELRVRLADCLLLHGEFRESMSISSQLAAASQAQQSYQNTVQVLRGFARLLSEDQQGALKDFQAVIEYSAPHPQSCVRALCGRGLLRMITGSHYLTALDYITASQLQPQDTALTVRCLVPWNYRGLLCTVLLEQGRTMLEEFGGQRKTSSNTVQDHEMSNQVPSTQPKDNHNQSVPTKEVHNINKDRIAVGVHALALLLMELQPGTDAPQILAADALYQLNRAEESYRLLLCTEHSTPRSQVLARLALLQLHRGFLYDAHQLLKKLIQCGDTSCLGSLLSVTALKDRTLLEKHCHDASKRILYSQQEESAIRKAVAYLSIAIMASGGEAVDSLLERARCYTLLGQKKTAIFDFTAILKEHPDHVPALCGRGFTYLMLNQQKESTQDILAALQVNAEEVTRSILSLKDKARKLICEWLHQQCRSSLSTTVSTNPVHHQQKCLQEVFLISCMLRKINNRDPRWHLLYIDVLLARGDIKTAGAHLRDLFGQEPRDAAAQARCGVVESWKKNFRSAAKCLSGVSEKDQSVLDFLLALIQPQQRKHLAQAASQEASGVSESGHWQHALALLTVAVQALGGTKLQHLRQRAACLAQLGLHERAVSDLDHVILCHNEGNKEEAKVRAEDLCRRGRSSLLCSRDKVAVEDFSLALELHTEQALMCVEAGPGRQHMAELFLRFALQNYGEKQLDKAWCLTESGLKVDSNHAELRRLKARINREVSGSCIVH